MRVVYLAAADSVHTVRWANEMTRRGYEIHLISMRPLRKGQTIERKITVHALRIRARAGYLLNAWALRRLLARIQPDLVHTHYASGYGTLSRLARFHPTLLSVWGSDVSVFPKNGALHRRLLIGNLEAADYLAATSYALRERVSELLRSRREVTVTPFGVDCDRFRPQVAAIASGDIVIGTVRSLELVHGVDDLIRTFAVLVKKKLPCEVRLRIVGEGSQRLELQRLATRLGVADRTEFVGWVEHEHLPVVLSGMSIFACFSRSESFGVAVLEASAAGLPVVATNVGGLPEVVQQGVTGYLVNGEVRQMVGAVEALVRDERLRAKMGSQGRRFVGLKYQWSESAKTMEAIYRRITASCAENEGYCKARNVALSNNSR